MQKQTHTQKHVSKYSKKLLKKFLTTKVYYLMEKFVWPGSHLDYTMQRQIHVGKEENGLNMQMDGIEVLVFQFQALN